MEKLIEEIYDHIRRCGELGVDIVCDECIKDIITRIGKAYADGMRLPDEVGRFSWPEEHEEWYDGDAEDFICDMFYEKYADTLIALRKEGQEEEG